MNSKVDIIDLTNLCKCKGGRSCECPCQVGRDVASQTDFPGEKIEGHLENLEKNLEKKLKDMAKALAEKQKRIDALLKACVILDSDLTESDLEYVGV